MASVFMRSQRNLQPVGLDHGQQGLGVTPRIIDWIVGVWGLPQVFEVLKSPGIGPSDSMSTMM
jgi:hypothetical protein